MSATHQQFVQAEKLRDDGKKEEALELLNQILAQDPSHVLSHLTAARICTQIGRHEEAILHSRKACELEPNDAFNFTALSVTYQRAYAGTGERQFIQLAEDAMAYARSIQ